MTPFLWSKSSTSSNYLSTPSMAFQFLSNFLPQPFFLAIRMILFSQWRKNNEFCSLGGGNNLKFSSLISEVATTDHYSVVVHCSVTVYYFLTSSFGYRKNSVQYWPFMILPYFTELLGELISVYSVASIETFNCLYSSWWSVTWWGEVLSGFIVIGGVT